MSHRHLSHVQTAPGAALLKGNLKWEGDGGMRGWRGSRGAGGGGGGGAE